MYGLNQAAGSVGLKDATYQPPTEEEMLRNRLMSNLWEYKNALAAGEAISRLVTSGVISPEEARRILDVDRFFTLLDEIESLSKD